MPAPSKIQEEIDAIEGAIRALGCALEDLRRAAATVGGQLDTSDSVAKPNYRRAEQQVRTAVNAATGAQKSLERRLALRRAVLERELVRSPGTGC
jgi:hypothetical protein